MVTRAIGDGRWGDARTVSVSARDRIGHEWTIIVRVTEMTGPPGYKGEVAVLSATSEDAGERLLGEPSEAFLRGYGVPMEDVFSEAHGEAFP